MLTRLHLHEVDSTNTYAKQQHATNIVVSSDHQTAGRGQGAHTWESVPQANLLFSIKVSPPHVAATEQFALSMVGALTIKSALEQYTSNCRVKWPNDIFCHDRKISGTLIETTILRKQVQDCIFGCGVNINQQTFLTAPHAISLCHITQKPIDREEVLAAILQQFEHYYSLLLADDYDSIYRQYNAALYRRHEYHRYEDKDGTFTAQILRVAPSGHLLLADSNGTLRRYETKELSFIL